MLFYTVQPSHICFHLIRGDSTIAVSHCVPYPVVNKTQLLRLRLATDLFSHYHSSLAEKLVANSVDVLIYLVCKALPSSFRFRTAFWMIFQLWFIWQPLKVFSASFYFWITSFGDDDSLSDTDIIFCLPQLRLAWISNHRDHYQFVFPLIMLGFYLLVFIDSWVSISPLDWYLSAGILCHPPQSDYSNTMLLCSLLWRWAPHPSLSTLLPVVLRGILVLQKTFTHYYERTSQSEILTVVSLAKVGRSLAVRFRQLLFCIIGTDCPAD